MHTRLTRLLAVTGLVFFGTAFIARAAERTHDIEAEDYFSIVTMTECAFSPDGARVAYTESRLGQAQESGVRRSCGSSICGHAETYAPDV